MPGPVADRQARVLASRRALEAATSEAQWQQTVMTTLQLQGWVAFHINVSVVKVSADGRHRYATPVTAQGRGFPDVIAVRAGRMLCIEVKTRAGRLSSEQQAWQRRLAQVPGVEAYVLRPADALKLQEIAA